MDLMSPEKPHGIQSFQFRYKPPLYISKSQPAKSDLISSGVFFRACFLVFIACLTNSLASSCNKKREIFPPFGSKPDICSVCTLSRLTSCSASIRHSSLQPVFSTVIKVPHPTPPTHTSHPRSLCTHSLDTEMRRGGREERRRGGEMERWRSVGGARLAHRGS